MSTGLTTTTTASTTTKTTASTTTTNSVLDKPLNELTEDDISQLTREDCRRYLKQKGMRRPSWNKSQAIQQVICLKSLLEPCSIKPPLLRVPQFAPPATTLTSTTVASNSSSSVKELSPGNDEGSLSALAEDGGPNQSAGPPCLDTSTEVQCRPASSSGKSILDRKKDAPHLPIGQMTIFYSGKVNVYDGLPVDKQAKAIMHLAANPIQFCQDEPSVGNLTHWSTPCKPPISNVKFNEATQDIPATQSVMAGREDIEGHANRQVSLQRYFEKRKDRGKFKVKRKVGSSSGLEMYLNHQLTRVPVTIGQITQSNACSSSQFGIVPPADSAVDKQTKHTGLSVDLNDKI